MSSKWKSKKDFSMKYTSLDSKKKKIIKKIALTAALLSTVTFNLAFANGEESKETINKIYHVYLGDTYIGPVSSEEAVTEIVEQKEQEASLQYKNMEVDASSDVSLVPEHVFSFDTNDSSTLEKLNTELEVQTPAYALQIDEEPVAYFKDEQDFEEAIRQLKLEYVTEKQLQQLENNTTTDLPDLKKNETRLLEVSIVENITVEDTKANPAEILSPDEAVDYLKSGSVEKELYAVQEGDVLGKIAKKHNLSMAELLKLNPDINENSLLQIGQKLNVTVEKPLVNIKVVYEKARIEKIDFTKVVKENDSMYKGEKVVKQEGEYGKKEVEYVITELNGNRVEKAVTEETVLSEPSDRVVVVGTKVVSDRGTGAFAWPTSGGYVSSNMGNRWGEFHRGLDIARPSNYNITASDNGVVTFAGWDGTYGQKIVVDHNNGYETVYAHLSEIKVSVGQVVPQGSIIGIMGSTGRSTGTHLHFEVHKNGSYVNPLSLLN
ncbi:murein DD-endopeptidase MepM/ murein hydrolase activator NlpD [Ureibacillus xyleni]|uniref:Murein DD-endopeptidase MepM/ murein hydrolase activator NlpD n=1 Tax=Ureibacillus xyleni TaxID=614648 RepID=A0A285SKL6_9BACL|nr:peptidoglycan DD-metalloendopeptidase family protein [Ureibacillus xyleni]SOC08186.1 murein DD-endopeptidase MepM/ murein hydrolase activator NlpD [Ureibacillus xyleni]